MIQLQDIQVGTGTTEDYPSTPTQQPKSDFLYFSPIKVKFDEPEQDVKLELSSFSQKTLEPCNREEIIQEARNKWGAYNIAPTICKICVNNLGFSECCPFSCDHCFHEKCMRMHILVQIEDSRFPVQCPLKECGKILLIEDIMLILNEEELEKYYRLSFKHYAASNARDLFGCPTPACDNYVFKTQEDSVIEQFCCGSCLKHYCMKCKSKWHPGISCEDAKQMYKQQDVNFEDFSTKKGFKRCPNCEAMIYRYSGCEWMQCRCGFGYCFTCLRSHYPYCHDQWVRVEKEKKVEAIYQAKMKEYKRAERERKEAERQKQYEIAARNPHTLWIFQERQKREEERKKKMFKPNPLPKFPEPKQTVKLQTHKQHTHED